MSRFVITALAAACLASPAAARPNVVVILVDDMGFSDIGCYGGEIPTPNLDKLAANGLRFTQFYNTGRCCPTRACVLTGLYPHQAGVGHMTGDYGVPGYRGSLNDRCVTLGDVARSAGYLTAATGKWHVGSKDRSMWPRARGFDRFYGVPEGGGFYFQVKKGRSVVLNDDIVADVNAPLPDGWYSTDAWTEYGLKFVDEARAAKKPFLLYLAHNAPHFPLQATAEDIAMFRGKYRAGWDELSTSRHRRQVASGLIDARWEPAGRPGDVAAWESLSDEQKDRFDHIMAVYAACIFRMDKSVGALVEGLKRRGAFDNTLILFMSDNGGNAESGSAGRTNGDPTKPRSSWFCGKSWAWVQNTPFRRFKHYNHEGGTATPLIAHWPNAIKQRGGFCREPAHLIDIMATVIDVADAEYPSRVNGKAVRPPEGKSLVPAFAGKPIKRDALYWEHEGNAAVRQGDWKLVRLGGRGRWELYDLKADRTEQNDLAAEQPERVRAMAAKWAAWAERCNVSENGPPRRAKKNKNRKKRDRKKRPAGRPNVLLILADDLGYSDLGCMGGEIPTPHLDELAAGGVRFTQCYNSARCCPTRASLVTGLYPHQAGIGSFARSRPDRRKGPAYVGRLNDKCVTLAEVLGSSGYQTYMVGKWHMSQPGPIKRGFGEFYGYTRGYAQNQWKPSRYERLPEGRRAELKYKEGEFYATDVFGDYALEFLKQARKKNAAGDAKPWFLYLAHSSPHFPVQAPKASIDKFMATYRRGWDALRSDRFERMKKSGLAGEAWTLTPRSTVPIDRPDIANGYPGKPNPAWDTLPADRREDLARRMAIFAAMVSHIDQGVGRLVADLKANGELENTLILFLSDNGACYEWGPFGFDVASRRGITKLHTGDELAKMGGPDTHHACGSAWANLCNTPLRQYKHFCYEGGNCTPLIAHWPAGITKPDRWVREPIHVMDVMPTLVEACGATYPTKFNGKRIMPAEGMSLVSAFSGDLNFGDRPIASEHNTSRSLRRGDWKVTHPIKMPWDKGWELYNIAKDRCETKNLADEKPELTSRLADEWLAWAKRVKAYPFYKEGKERPARRDARSPKIAGRPLTVAADFELATPTADGVILAHGGREHGYSLHVENGALIFSVRVAGKVTATKPHRLKSSRAKAVAKLLDGGGMELNVNGERVATATAPGLIPVQPKDSLSVGRDVLTAVGNYAAPMPLKGKVTKVTVNGGVFLKP